MGILGSMEGAPLSRALNRLTARKVASLKIPGRHADGGGLYLRITPKGARSWVFMTASDGKRAEIGLGAEAAVSLAAARKVSADMREAVALGHDPRAIVAQKLEADEPTPLTFGVFAETYIASVEGGWRNEIHRQQWRNSLRDHAGTLKNRLIADIGTEDVLAVLQPIWLNKSETASRVRGRIEKILAAAKARGLRPIDASNPALWKGHLEVLLPKQPKLVRGHHAALQWREAPTFMTDLRKRPALAARALEFTILTAARSGETLSATWGEIDFDQKLWTIPGHRMKAAVQHVVPLSDAAMSVLGELKPDEPQPQDLIFAVGGAARSNMAMAMLLRRMGRTVTTLGMRSTFRDWAGDATEFPRDLIEQALAHTISDKLSALIDVGPPLNAGELSCSDGLNIYRTRCHEPVGYVIAVDVDGTRPKISGIFLATTHERSGRGVCKAALALFWLPDRHEHDRTF